MNIFLQDPNEIRLSPEEVRVCEMKITSTLKGGRVKIYLVLTPFMKRPNIDVTITNASGKEVAHASILETMLPKMEFTMHLREHEPGIEYRVEARVYYQRMPEPTETGVDIQLPDPMIVATHKAIFNFPPLET